MDGPEREERPERSNLRQGKQRRHLDSQVVLVYLGSVLGAFACRENLSRRTCLQDSIWEPVLRDGQLKDPVSLLSLVSIKRT